jgi:hypothetical protein
MAGADYIPQIREMITPGEREEDVVKMIDILADARTHGLRPPGWADFRFSAAIWCAVLRPFKPPAYQSGIARVRLLFRGIATDLDLKACLQRSFTRTLLQVRDERAAIARGVAALFDLPNTNTR